MPKLSRNILRSLLLLVVIVILLLLYLQFAAARVHHGFIENAVSDAVGFDVTTTEDFQFSLGKKLAFSASALAINHNERLDDEPLANIGELRLIVDTWSLISGPLEVDLIELTGVKIRLRAFNDGGSNWTNTAVEPEPESADAGAPPILHDIRVNNIDIQLAQDGQSVWQVLAELNGTVAASFPSTGPLIKLELSTPKLEIRLPESEDAAPAESDATAMLFDDSPIGYLGLDQLGLTANIAADIISINDESISNFSVAISVSDGVMQIDPLQFNYGGGSISSKLALAPEEELHSLSFSTEVKALRFAAMAVGGQDPKGLPPLDAIVEIAGTGESLHAIMAAANGKISGRHSTGQVGMQMAGALFSDIFSSLLKSLNPLAETQPYTTLDCGIYDLEIIDGIATVKKLAVQTENLTVMSEGDINLETEAIDLSLSTKSREGLGISLGGVANSFVRLSGTLSDPTINMDAAGTVTTTGAAVATGGLSVLAKGLWDRLSAEADICSDAQPAATE